MNIGYKLIPAKIEDINILIKYKTKIICEYAHNLSEKELKEINDYVKNEVKKQIYNIKLSLSKKI